MDRSEIQDFYGKQTILLTGATGGLGTVLLEKLTRLCRPRKIHLLVRPKKGKTAQERLETILSDRYFDKVKADNPIFDEIIHVIAGDIQQPNLGLTGNDAKLLQEEITCIIHAAANVRFDQSLEMATYNNVRAVDDLLKLAKNMHQLQSFVHVSTAYSNCNHLEIGEEFYKPPISYRDLLGLIEGANGKEALYSQIAEKMVEKYHNTYTFTKSVGEDLIRSEGANLPVAIVRPAIIMPTALDPLPGWLNNFYGVIGVTIGMSLGVIRTLCVNYGLVCALVPCDYVANNILASGWEVANRKRDRCEKIRIYNYCGAEGNWITWGEYAKQAQKLVRKYAPARAIWHVFFVTTENLFIYRLLTFLLHTVPALCVDFSLTCMGKKPKFARLYEKVVSKGVTLTNPFRLYDWKFAVDNVYDLYDNAMSARDKELFDFDMRKFDWLRYSDLAAKGSRIYLLEDPMSTLKMAQRKQIVLCVLHWSILAVLGYLFFRLGLFLYEAILYLADY